MTDATPEQLAQESPDEMVGEPVQAEHQLDITAFVEDDEVADVDPGTVQ